MYKKTIKRGEKKYIYYYTNVVSDVFLFFINDIFVIINIGFGDGRSGSKWKNRGI